MEPGSRKLIKEKKICRTMPFTARRKKDEACSWPDRVDEKKKKKKEP
jgi:hypothetical protein